MWIKYCLTAWIMCMEEVLALRQVTLGSVSPGCYMQKGNGQKVSTPNDLLQTGEPSNDSALIALWRKHRRKLYEAKVESWLQLVPIRTLACKACLPGSC